MTTKRLKKKRRLQRMAEHLVATALRDGVPMARRQACRRVKTYLRLVKARAARWARSALGDVAGVKVKVRHVVE